MLLPDADMRSFFWRDRGTRVICRGEDVLDDLCSILCRFHTEPENGVHRCRRPDHIDRSRHVFRAISFEAHVGLLHDQSHGAALRRVWTIYPGWDGRASCLSRRSLVCEGGVVFNDRHPFAPVPHSGGIGTERTMPGFAGHRYRLFGSWISPGRHAPIHDFLWISMVG